MKRTGNEFMKRTETRQKDRQMTDKQVAQSLAWLALITCSSAQCAAAVSSPISSLHSIFLSTTIYLGTESGSVGFCLFLSLSSHTYIPAPSGPLSSLFSYHLAWSFHGSPRRWRRQRPRIPPDIGQWRLRWGAGAPPFPLHPPVFFPFLSSWTARRRRRAFSGACIGRGTAAGTRTCLSLPGWLFARSLARSGSPCQGGREAWHHGTPCG
ncbi:uncharacterized protein K452DRAFT_144810 [Aplosporella prunicola CBS 121167]|uniref:Uncharacterized protein n=1 Tax=Aplosporella prunicola CBS 121167 TaxID=1176127 RepID=A0A6A6BP48_9PEZI|nr:uncharacterized protein K452DRAFT_144810 [Aplosporella prunicola CBS 121167]KAF2144627.1 hypothetical protein K452DRAFT_144810 [Aplosporella prunicola CBS 121167]